MNKTIVAVLTADIVGSSSLGKKQLQDLTKVIQAEMKENSSLFDFYRGDSFHALVSYTEALYIATKLRTIARTFPSKEAQKNMDIRISIGIGTADQPIKNIATASGEAFNLSGRELDKIAKTSQRLAIRCAEQTVDIGFAAIAAFTDFILQKLSVKQAEIILELLKGATELEIAKKLNKTQPVVNKSKQAALWTELEYLLKLFQQLALTIH